MKRRRIEALRALAERPGTPAEGAVARALLEKAEATPSLDNPLGKYARFMRSGSMDDLRDAVGSRTCDCGTKIPAFTKCANATLHAKIAAEIREKFPRGTRVYYNQWAYVENDTGTVTGYSKEWNWVRVKFNNLKTIRSVPIYSAKGWHLSAVPIDRETLDRTGLGGFTKAEKDAMRADLYQRCGFGEEAR